MGTNNQNDYSSSSSINDDDISSSSHFIINPNCSFLSHGNNISNNDTNSNSKARRTKDKYSTRSSSLLPTKIINLFHYCDGKNNGNSSDDNIDSTTIISMTKSSV